MYANNRFDQRSSGNNFNRAGGQYGKPNTQRRTFIPRRSFDEQSDDFAQPTYEQLMSSLYTFEDRHVKTRSLRQAYEHAAMIHRAKRMGPTPRVLFPAGTWTKEDEKPTLTLVGFSDKVNEIVQNLRFGKYKAEPAA